MYSLGQNNPPRIGFTLVKSRIKKIRRREQGAVNVKWLVLDFTVLWQTALKCTADHGIPRYLNCGLPRRKKSYGGLPRGK
jgi:hypothetical protein